MALDLDGPALEETVRHDRRNSGRQRSGPGQHASRKPGGRDGDYKPGSGGLPLYLGPVLALSFPLSLT